MRRSTTRPPSTAEAARSRLEEIGSEGPHAGDAVAAGHVLDKLRQGVCVFDGAWRLVLFNRRYAEMYDLPYDSLRLGMTLQEVVDLRHAVGTGPSRASEQDAGWLQQARRESHPAETIVRLQNRRVVEIWHEPSPDGGWMATHQDITERADAEDALRQKTALLDATLDTMDQGLLMVDAEGVVRVCNERALVLLDLPPALMRSQPTLNEVGRYQMLRGDFVRSEDAERRWPEHARSTENALSYERERPDGTVLEIRTVMLPDGSAVRTYTDITQRKQAEVQIAESEARLRALTDGLPQMVWLAQAGDGTALYTNQRFVDYVGDEVGPTRRDRIANHHPDDRERVAREWAVAEREGRRFETEERWRRSDGTYHWHKTIIAPVHRDGEIIEWLGSALDIDAIVTAREALRLREERFAFALEAGSDGLWDRNLVTGELWRSDRWYTMLGYDPKELAAQGYSWEALVHPDDIDRALQARAAHLQGRTDVFECEHRLLTKRGTYTWVLTRGKVVERDAQGNPLRAVGTHIDIAGRKAAEAQITFMARHDGLTGLPNRALFRERLDQRLAEVGRLGGSCAVLCLDLDRFKSVNDMLGHLAGDALLCEIAQRLRAVLRTEDTVARLGGDEFAILVDGRSGPAGVAKLAERLISAVREPATLGDHQVEVGLSVGVALAPEDGEDRETVFRRADLALYRAKAEGRNTVRVFERAMDEAAAGRRKLEGDLRRAIARGEFILHYQPQVRSATNELVGFEALVRWQPPGRGLVPPSAFIPLAEETGLIVPLGEWVLRTACREAARWNKPLKVAVNVSARQFQQIDLPDMVLGILTETGLSPARLELEITETLLINDMARALGILRRLKSLGICIAVDDFGTGYSSLATLQAFPFDKIKIDRSFVGTLEKSHQAAVIVRAVLGLGRSLGMGVIAEGVETPEQMRFLTEEACEVVQGYLLGRPQPIEHFASDVYGDEPRAAGPPRTIAQG